MRAVHALVPAGIDDLERPSGGNTYDRKVLDGLQALGWELIEHRIRGSWPRPGRGAVAALAGVVAAVPPDAVLLVDGLIACASAHVLGSQSSRPSVVLVHMPIGTTEPAAAVGERRVLAAASAVVTTSTWTRNLLLELYDLRPADVHVALPGVEPAPLAPGTPGGGELLCVAALAAHKGQVDLVSALELVADLPWSCRLVGAVTLEPCYVAGLLERVAVVGLSDRVRLTGPLSGAGLLQAYAAADLLVLPSHAETYGMVVTESLARGIPVIATRVGGVPEALGDTAAGSPGLLVPPGEPAALAGALRAWLTDGHLRARLRGRAVERRSALTAWSRTAEEVSAVLEGVRGG